MESLLSPTFMQAFAMILREGLESILIFSALSVYVVKLGAAHRVKTLYGGALAALAASVLTGFAAVHFWRVDELHEGLEGLMMLGAAVLMVYVSGWLYYRQDPAVWTKYLKDKVGKALLAERVWPVVALAFLAIYREGLETVMFLMALASQAGGWVAPIWEAVIVGAALLAVVFVAIRHFALRLPLRPIFILTSAVLFVMAVHFVLEGVHELQEAAWLPLTEVGLGDELTLEALIPAAALVLAALGGVIWLRGKAKGGV